MKAILTGLLLALAATCGWAGAPGPIETTPNDPLLAPFLKPGSFRRVTLSPDGNHIAALVSNGINNAVASIDTDTMKMRVIVQSMVVPAHVYVAHMANPIFVSWVANDILAVNYNDGSAWTFDIHGARGRDLFAGWRMGIRDSSGHNTDWMIVQRDIHKTEGLSRYNARTGENYSVDIDVKGKVIDWLADANGDIRMAKTMDTAFWSDSTRLTTWYRDVQVFASHGYAVFQPQFRGSTGFGKKFEESGYGQWGQAMQGDITAGVHWLIDQKIADPARICIVGASYGGYAALWGLVKTPELYKCGVSTAGVSDLEHMLHDDSDTSQSAVGREYERTLIGDPKLMKASWSSVSPLQHADRIVAPLLIVHGDLDRRVPISHGKAMLAEMQRLHKDVQWLEFSAEGHGVSHIKNAEKWYAAMFALFERTIGKGVPPPNAARAGPAAAPASAASAAR
jgi:dienelactone hydrolase